MANDRQFYVEVQDAQGLGVSKIGVSRVILVGSRVTGTAPVAGSSLVTNAGNGQSGTVGTAIGTVPSVKILDGNGQPVAGSTVSWRIAQGTSATTTGNPNTTTNASGVATIGGWSLGTTAGQVNILEAYSGNLTNSPLSFQVTPVALSASSATVSAGDSQQSTPLSLLASRLSALVHDVYGNVVQSSTVTWSSSDAGGTFSGDIVSGNTSATNSSGIAGIEYTTGQSASTQTVWAVVDNSLVSAHFIVGTRAGPAALLTIGSGDNQIALSSATLALPCIINVGDGNNNVVGSGNTIQMVIVTGSGRLSSATSTPVNSQVSVQWQMGAVAGLNQLEVSILGVSNSTITFNASGTNPLADTVIYESGGTQTAVVATSPTLTLCVATTASGVSAAGQTINWSITSEPNSNGLNSAGLSVAQAVSSTTGVARTVLSLGSYVGIYGIAASHPTLIGPAGLGSPVTFHVTATADVASKLTVRTAPQSNPLQATDWSPQPVIASMDSWGNLVSTNTRVGIVKYAGGPGAGTLSSTVSMFAVASGATATFAGIQYSAADAFQCEYRCNSLSTATSPQQQALPPFANKVAFTVQPSNCVVSTNISPAVKVEIQDSLGVVVPNATDPVVLAYVANPGAGVLGGTLTQNAVAGVATFANLTNSVVATGYSLGATSGTLTAATSSTYNVTAASATNEPTDVTFTTAISTDWSTEAADTAFTNPSTHQGWTVTTSATNLKVRSLANQSWRDAEVAAIPTTTSDKVLVCRFVGSTANSKGKMYVTYSNKKTAYFRTKVLVTDNFIGHNSLQYKLVDGFAGGGNPYIGDIRGSTGNLSMNIALQAANNNSNNVGGSFTRNVWHTWETVMVAESASAAGDGHVTHYLNGTKVKQVTGIQWTTTGGQNMSQWEMINYYGGTGTNGNTEWQYVCTCETVVKTSTSRAALPA